MRTRRLPKLRLRRIRGRRRLRFRRPRLPRISFRDSLTKLPNLLTYLRIAAIPGVVWLLHMGGHGSTEEMRFWSLMSMLGFTVAALTDLIDGWLARAWNLGTLLGRFLDPVADKLLIMALLVELTALGRLPAWVAIIIIAREMFINGLRTVAMSEGIEVPVGAVGKWKTTFQMFGVGGLLLYYPWPIPGLGWVLPARNVGFTCLVIALILSVTSAVTYVRNCVRELLRREDQ